MYRCVNIDWLEVFCLEDVSCNHDAQFFRDHGFVVKSREYGAPQYAEMFTIESKGYDFIEIRRNPYSKKTQDVEFHKYMLVRAFGGGYAEGLAALKERFDKVERPGVIVWEKL